MKSMRDRFRQCIGDGPAVSQALADLIAREAQFSFPRSNVLRLAVERQLTVVPFVGVLRQGHRPPHIAGFVMAVVVGKPIDRMQCRRAGTHVGQEGGEVVFPAGADDNPAPAVVRPRGVLRVQASHLDPTPHVVLRRDTAGTRMAMRSASSGQLLALQTTAGLAGAVLQRHTPHRHVGAAVAVTAPATAFDVIQRNQAAKALVGQVGMRSSHQRSIATSCEIER